MANKFCVNLTCAKDNPDKATVAFVIANRKLDESSLVPGAAIGGGAKLVELLSDDSPGVSY